MAVSLNSEYRHLISGRLGWLEHMGQSAREEGAIQIKVLQRNLNRATFEFFNIKLYVQRVNFHKARHRTTRDYKMSNS